MSRQISPAARQGLTLVGLVALVAFLVTRAQPIRTSLHVQEETRNESGEPGEPRQSGEPSEVKGDEPPERPLAPFLAGRVVLPAGVPVDLVRLDVRSDAVPGGEAVRTIVTASPTGAWRLDDIPIAHYRIDVSFRWRGRHYRGSAEADAGDDAVEIALQTAGPTPREILVRVVDGSGEPIRGGSVAVHPKARPDAPSSIRVQDGEAVIAIFEGHGPLWFEFWDGPPERCGAAVIGPLADIPDVFDVELPLPRSIEGSVLGQDGEPASGFKLTARALHADEESWHLHATATSDEHGSFCLRGLGDLVYEVRAASPPEYEDVEPWLLRGGAQGITIDLRTAATVEITVLDASGEPSAGAWVTALLRGKPFGHVSAVCDSSGVARLRGVNLGLRYSLSVYSRTGGQDRGGVTIEDWRPRSTTIHLER